MRTLLAALGGFLVVAGLAAAQKGDPTKPGVTLKVGDPAPALKATKWLQGKEVKAFETGKVYVVEFWATWCGPCIVMMPHLSSLQTEYKSKGVTIIGFTTKGRSNEEEKVVAFVKKRGPKLKYTFAYAEEEDTNNAWMKAAGRTGIPCSFVVDGGGKIAYIGHPMFLDYVLPRVVAGKWKGEKSKTEIAAIEKQVNGVFGKLRDPEEGLKAIGEFEKKYPEMSNIPYFTAPKISYLVKTNKTQEARKVAGAILKRGIKHDDPTALQAVSASLRTAEAKDDKELQALSLKAAKALLEVSGDKDWQAQYNLAETYHFQGDNAKAREHGKKALEALDNPRFKDALEKQIQRYGEEKKG